MRKSQGQLDPEELSFYRTVRLRKLSMAIGAGGLFSADNQRVILCGYGGCLSAIRPFAVCEWITDPILREAKLVRQSCMSSWCPVGCEREICATVLLMHRHARGPLIDCRVWEHNSVMTVLISIRGSCRSRSISPIYDSIAEIWLPSIHIGLLCDL